MGRGKKTAGAKLHRDDDNPAVESEASEVEQPEPVEEEPAAKAEPEPPPPKPPPEPVAKEEPEIPKPEKQVTLVVAEGKSLITKRGVRGPGDDVTAKELAGGEEQLQSLKDKGFLEGAK